MTIQSVELSRFPWSRPLVSACLRDYGSVSSLFAGDPRDPGAWRQITTAVQGSPRDHAAVSALLKEQLERRSAPFRARDAAASLADPRTVAIVTGQQAGLFGGPLYTVLKAITAIQLARRIGHELGLQVVPVFWVEADDHDWKEIRSVEVLDAEHQPRVVHAPDLAGGGKLPVHRLTFDNNIATTISDLAAVVQPTGFTGDVQECLARHYRTGVSVARAFAGLMDELLGAEGLVVFEGYDPAAKALAADVFVNEIAHPGRTAAQAAEGARAMQALGHAPQIEPQSDSVALFYLAPEGRTAIRRRGDVFIINDNEVSAADLEAEAASHPERFSPNVLLRPVVQDRILPTICYVAGPAELAYQAQLGDVYRSFGIVAPLLMPRVSATILDSAAARFIERHKLQIEDFCMEEDTALSRLVERAMPVDVENAVRAMQDAVAERAGAVKTAIVNVDPTLAGAVDTTVDKVRDTLQTLQHKVVQASKRNDETLRRQFTRTYALVYPEAVPQERALGVVFFLNRYGMGFVQELVGALPLETDLHHVLTI